MLPDPIKQPKIYAEIFFVYGNVTRFYCQEMSLDAVITCIVSIFFDCPLHSESK